MSLLNSHRISCSCLLLLWGAFAGFAQASQFKFAPAVPLDLPTSFTLGFRAPSLSSDGRTLFFNSLTDGGQGGRDIWMTTRSDRFGSFGPVENLGPNVNSAWRDGSASLSRNGLSLYFHSDRPGSVGGLDIYVATRATTSDAFGTPVLLDGAGVNSGFSDGNPAISADELTLYFTSDRPGGFSEQDNYFATRPNTSAPFGDVTNLGPAINGFAGHGSPSASADGLSLFFAGSNGFEADLYVSTRDSESEAWGAPENLGTNVNTSSDEDLGEFAWDGLSIVFNSDRSGIDRLYEAAVVFEPGDTDHDGDVDLDDLNNVRNNFGTTGLPVLGDTTPFDGDVDLDDLNAVRNNFGGEPGSSAVPEPAAWVLAVLALAGATLPAARARRRS